MRKIEEFQKELTTKKEAMEEMERFINTCKEYDVKEKSFHLYYHKNEYKICADSVKDKYLKGDYIKEYVL